MDHATQHPHRMDGVLICQALGREGAARDLQDLVLDYLKKVIID
ncbi:hypothetical protein [Thermogemmatispora carboxidivorans]|nr:hypothetical protein [Thermogemmatispora carboxidivorans]